MVNEDREAKLDIELTDEVHSAEGLESTIAASMSNEDAAAINQRVNEIPRFIKDEGRPSLNSKTVAHHLEAARRALAQAETKANLSPSPATATPVFGKLWGRIRGQMHDLVLFYVNRLGGTTGRVDSQLIEAIEELTALVEQQQAEIEALKKNRVESRE